jgi:rubrerythrin
MGMEQGAIDFYLEIAGRLPAAADVIRKIVDMERMHLANLQALVDNTGAHI